MKGNYTEKEIALLKEHTNQIVCFLVPLKKEIRSYHEIRFGDKCGHFGDYEYRLSFNPNWIYGGMGRCSIALEENCPSCDYTLDNSYSAPDFMAKSRKALNLISVLQRMSGLGVRPAAYSDRK